MVLVGMMDITVNVIHCVWAIAHIPPTLLTTLRCTTSIAMWHLKSLDLNPHLHIYTSSPRLLASAKLSSIANLKSSSSVSAP